MAKSNNNNKNYSGIEKQTISSSPRATLRWTRRGKNENILLVAFFRPQVRNAINDDVYEDLIYMLKTTAKDESISAVVLTGAGSFFSSGADMKDSVESVMVPKDETWIPTPHRPVGRFMMEWLQYPKLVAAAVNGPAVGVGTTLLLHCDLVVCSATATFWTPFTRMAFVPEFCSSATFMSTMGLAKANEMLLLGKKLDAQTAVDWNLVSRVVQNHVDMSGDPFHPKSLANQLCDELDEKLLQLPCAHESVKYFCSMVRGSKRKSYQSICYQELLQLEERIQLGQAAQALKALAFGKTSKKKTKLKSKL